MFARLLHWKIDKAAQCSIVGCLAFLATVLTTALQLFHDFDFLSAEVVAGVRLLSQPQVRRHACRGRGGKAGRGGHLFK